MQAKDIIFLVPTRGRPDSARQLVEAWRETESEAVLSFWVDDDDPAQDGYHQVWEDYAPTPGFEIHYEPRRRLAGTLNYAVAARSEHFKMPRDYKAIGFLGDDHRPRTMGWDRRFAECLSGGAGVVYGNDLLMGSKMPTAVCMTSDIPAKLGYYCPPGMVHLCLDLVWKDWGEGMGRITYLPDVIIEHMHPANNKAQMDAGYQEVNSHEQVSADTKAYIEYRDGGQLAEDIERLRQLP